MSKNTQYKLSDEELITGFRRQMRAMEDKLRPPNVENYESPYNSYYLVTEFDAWARCQQYGHYHYYVIDAYREVMEAIVQDLKLTMAPQYGWANLNYRLLTQKQKNAVLLDACIYNAITNSKYQILRLLMLNPVSVVKIDQARVLPLVARWFNLSREEMCEKIEAFTL